MNATTKQETTALTVIERASLALGSSGKAKELMTMAQSSQSIVAITNPASYQECHAARMALKNERIAIAKQGKEARDDATKFSKAVIAEEARLIGIIEPEETRLQAIQDAHDAKIEADKAAKAEAEANRIAGIQRQIADIVALPGLKSGMLSGYIDDAFVRLQEVNPEKWADEFLPMALDAKTRSLQALATMRDGALAQEQAKAAEEARIKAEREELARLRAEQEERNRQETAQRAEAEKESKAVREAAEAKLAAERAELDRQRQEQEAAQAAIDAERAELAKKQAEQEAAAQAAAEKIKQDAALNAGQPNAGAAVGGSQPVDASAAPASGASTAQSSGQIPAMRVAPAPDQQETITITKKLYESLLDDQRFLDCLRGAGVDNWSGYDEACDMYNQEEEAA